MGQKKWLNESTGNQKDENHEKEVQGWAGQSENVQPHLVVIPKGKAREKGARLLFEEIMSQNYSERMKDVNPQI